MRSIDLTVESKLDRTPRVKQLCGVVNEEAASGQGFGFIRPDDGGGDVFVHARDIANADKLNQGQRVSFETVTDEKRGKLRADRVRVI